MAERIIDPKRDGGARGHHELDFSEMMLSMSGLLHLVGDEEVAEITQKMVGLMRPLLDALG